MLKNVIKKWGLSVISIIAGSILILMLLLFFNINTVKTVERFIHDGMDEMKHTAVVSLNHDFDSFVDLLEQQAKLFGLLKEPSDQEIMDVLYDFAGEDRFKNTAILTYDGRVYSSYRGITKIQESDNVQNLQKHGTTISQPRTFLDGTLVIDISAPVSLNGEEVGKLVVTVGGDALARMFSNHILQGDASLLLLAQDGTVITEISAKENPLFAGENAFAFYKSDQLSFINGSLESFEADMNMSKSGWIKYRSAGETICASYEPFGINGWYMMITATDNTLNVQAGSIKKNALLLTIGIFAVMAAASVLIFIQRTKEQERLASLKNTYSVAIRKTNDLFYEADIDSDQLIDYSENSDKAIWKDTPKHYSSALIEVANICAPECRQQFLDTFLPQNIKIKMQEGISSINFEYKITPDENTVRWLSATFVPVVDGSSNTTKLICMENDITEQRLKQENLNRSAMIDSLTGLFNKASTKQFINAFFANEGGEGDHAFVMIDIDYFKSINDRLGHMKGDEVLMEFGHALRRIFRKSDIVGRIGGDEFVVLLKNYGVAELIQAKMREVGNAMRKEHSLTDDASSVVKTTASMGIAIYGKDGTDFDTLYQHADEALYRSKDAGRDTYTFYTNP